MRKYVQRENIFVHSIPPEMVLATQREGTGHKQHEIDMTNVMPTQSFPTQTIFHQATFDLTLGPGGIFNTGIGNAKHSRWGLHPT